MWDETAGERGPELSETTSGSTPTDDPNGTLPQLSWGASGLKEPADPAFADGATRYRILGPLGEGGMGVVYRAEDTRLGRTVAIKTIPAELTTNQRAKERFLNEARAASALDHPNLCTVYEIEETPKGQLYLFMPCYDGETLRSRLQRGPLPLPEAIHVAQQVARGLAKAHRQGIVHCDVKPANLMLTADGVVKILDFGIARLSGQASPVQARPSGTPKYRSPEQARGDEVDASSDIWSLGMVLYEMVTGQMPLRDERGRISWEESARRLPEVPPELDAILSRMLAYSPADRYPDAAALLADLDRLEEWIGDAAVERRVARQRQKLLVAGVVLVVVCLALLAGSLINRRSGSALQPNLIQLTDFPGKTSYPSLSPDGSTVLYVRPVGGRSHIFSQPSIPGANAVDLTADSPADDTQPAFSPDGKQIAFRSERGGGGIFIMPADGSIVRRLTSFGFHPAWSPDGKGIVCSTTSITTPQIRPTDSEVFWVDVKAGTRRLVTRGDAAQPSWSPHGQRIAYWGVQHETGQRIIWTVPAEGGDPIPVVADDHLNWNPVWSPDGHYLYFASNRSGVMNLWRVPIIEGSGLVAGEPEPITTLPGMLPSFSHDGRKMVYASDDSKATLEKVGFDPETGEVEVFGPAGLIVQTTGMMVDCAASPDGKWLAYQLLAPREELFIVHPDGSGLRRLIGDAHKNRLPQFSPDSSRLAFYSNRGGKYEIWTIGVDGRGLAQETSTPGKFISTPLWSPSGNMLAAEVAGSEAFIDLTVPLSERLPKFLPRPAGGIDFIAYSWSPDGKRLAGARQLHDGSHDPGILLYSLLDKKYVQLTSHGHGPRWLHDSWHLLYSEGNGIFLLDAQTGKSRPILSYGGSAYSGCSVSPNDRILYLTRTIPEGQIWLLKSD